MEIQLLLLFVCGAAQASADDEAHVAALAKANEAVERAAAQAQHDPARPIYHVMAASRFINDPNGPVYFNGEYHVFFQHLPFWSETADWTRPTWGHAVSPDLVHWRHLPIALAPSPGTYDAEAIASGCCVINDGVPTIIYTGVGNGRQTQCLATSHDGMRTWRKDPANPVIPDKPPLAGLDDGFRDPCAWREGQEWRLLAGSGFKDGGGTVLLYRSLDLHQWEFLGPLCSGMGRQCFQWECPTFFPLNKKHVLIVSPLYRDAPGLRGMVEYAVGAYADNRFTPGPWRPVDLGGPTVYYAPNSFADAHDRRILWGWIMAERPGTAGWCHCLSLPRVLTLADDDTLRCEPAPELAALRRNERALPSRSLPVDQEILLEEAFGGHGELQVEIELGDATRVELRVGRSADRTTFTPLAYDTAGCLVFGDKHADFRLSPDKKTLTFRLFVDGCIGEAYINDQACFTNIIPPNNGKAGVSIIATGGTARLKRARLWDMATIWPES